MGFSMTREWDISCIAPSLWVGAASAVCTPCLEAVGVTHVLSVMRDGPCLIPGVIHLTIDALDTESEFLLDGAASALKFIQDAFVDHGCVLVHCQQGQSRSIAVVAAFLMHSRKISALAAHNVIAATRRIDINPAFQIQLLIFQHSCDVRPSLHTIAHSRWRLARLQSRIFASHYSSIADLQPFAAPPFPEDAFDATRTQCLRCANCCETIALQGNVVPLYFVAVSMIGIQIILSFPFR
jgi:dual specificity phosphatase 12